LHPSVDLLGSFGSDTRIWQAAVHGGKPSDFSKARPATRFYRSIVIWIKNDVTGILPVTQESVKAAPVSFSKPGVHFSPH